MSLIQAAPAARIKHANVTTNDIPMQENMQNDSFGKNLCRVWAYTSRDWRVVSDVEERTQGHYAELTVAYEKISQLTSKTRNSTRMPLSPATVTKKSERLSDTFRAAMCFCL